MFRTFFTQFNSSNSNLISHRFFQNLKILNPLSRINNATSNQIPRLQFYRIYSRFDIRVFKFKFKSPVLNSHSISKKPKIEIKTKKKKNSILDEKLGEKKPRSKLLKTKKKDR